MHADEPIIRLKCGFCHSTTTWDDAPEAGWIPDYYKGQTVVDQPTCPDCAARRLRRADDGEFELIGHRLGEVQ